MYLCRLNTDKFGKHLRIYFLIFVSFGFLNLVSFVSTLKLKFVLGVGDGIA